MMASLVPNISSANCLANSVLPTPVGPTKRKLPIGRFPSSNHTSNVSYQTNSESSSASSANTGFQSAAPNAILMEATTGTILYEKDADKEKPPASVTKVMTLLLIFEALSKKQITLNDTVTVSEHAASMGGSQVFLEPGETQSVDTMIKCIAVSSANDACVAYSHSRN